MAAGMPKAFVPLRGCPLLWHCVQGLLASGCIHLVVIAVGAQHHDRARAVLAEAGEQVKIVTGGAHRSDSVRAALHSASDADVVVVHDAARCLAPISVIQSVVHAVVAGAPAVVPVLTVVDTIKQVDEDGTVVATLDRSELRAVQTPQGFRRAVLEAAHAAGVGRNFTDDAALVEAHGGRVAVVDGADEAFKITRPWDLALAEAVARR